MMKQPVLARDGASIKYVGEGEGSAVLFVPGFETCLVSSSSAKQSPQPFGGVGQQPLRPLACPVLAAGR